MKFVKQFEVTIGIEDPILFCTDKESHTMMSLRAEYEGICFKGALIVKIIEIRNISACEIVTTNNKAHGEVHVRFIAHVVTLGMWDILVGVEIVQSTPVVIGKYVAADGVKAAVGLIGSSTATTFVIGQKIPVRIILAIHDVMKQPSVGCTLLTGDKAAPFVSIKGILDASAKSELGPMYDAICEELQLRRKLDQKKVAFFEELLYYQRGNKSDFVTIKAGATAVWSGPSTPPLAGDFKEINIMSVVEGIISGKKVNVAGIWQRPLSICRSSPIVAVLKSGAPIPEDVQQKTPIIAFAEFMKNILDFLVAIREMTLLYNTDKMIADHANVWASMV